MDGSLGIFIEGLVAVLLVVTIGYCVLVNRKLEQLRSNQSELRQIIRELNAATGQAETAIAALRTTADASEEAVAKAVEESRELVAQLRAELTEGQALLAKIAAIVRAQRQAARPGAAAAAGPAPDRTGTVQPLRASAVGIGLLNAQARDAAGPHIRRRRSVA